jgi:hypothetical protein
MKHEKPACIGEIIPRNPKATFRQWDRRDILMMDPVNTTTIPGNVLALASQNSNINHAFHDDFWSALSAYRCRNITVIYQVSSPWLEQLIHVAAKTYNWTIFQTTADAVVCASETMYLNGHMRNLNYFDGDNVPAVRMELRCMALKIFGIDSLKPKKKHVVIYTRMDSPYRQVKNVEALIQLFDKDKFEVMVQPKLPVSFWEQVELFAGISLFVAPNGGWSPNVLWLPDDVCVIELHLYREDSWIKMFGLEKVFAPAHFITVTGSYSDTTKPRLQRKNRIGGDDDIMGDRVVADLKQTIEKNPACKQFLNTSFYHINEY